MKGFFDKNQFQAPSYKSEKGVFSCVSCGLYKFAMNPKMKPYGAGKRGIMVIGEAPGEAESEKGKPWQGKMGRVLQRKYRELGIDLFEDCISLNAVNCRPVDKKGNNRAPTEHEIACCRPKVISAIKQYEPKVIILQGGSAVSSLISGYRWHGNPTGITAWRGWTIPEREYSAWVCPTFHPSFIERQEEENEAELIWTSDLKQAFSLIDKPFPSSENEESCIVITEDVRKVLSTILKQKPPLLVFDLETTGIKPYNKENHQIVTISFCYDYEKAYAVPFSTDAHCLVLLKKILKHPAIGKIAANMKYEDNWMTILHNINVNPWVFDTMLATHILDNRPGICRLEFQCYVQFGLQDYSKDISPYLKSIDANTPNRIMELVKDPDLFRKLLLYNGMDSLMTYRLAMKQMELVKYEGGSGGNFK